METREKAQKFVALLTDLVNCPTDTPVDLAFLNMLALKYDELKASVLREKSLKEIEQIEVKTK